MNAQSINEWSVTSGDFHRSAETDYEKKFQSAKVRNKLFVNKVVIAFSLSGLGIMFLVLELITNI